MKFSKNCGRILSRIPAYRALGRGLTLCGAPRGQGSSASLWGGTARGWTGVSTGEWTAPGLSQLRLRPSRVGLLCEPRSSRSQSIIRWTLLRLVSPSSAFPFPPLSGCFHLGVLGPTFKSLSMPDFKPQTQHYNLHFSSKTSRSVFEKII